MRPNRRGMPKEVGYYMKSNSPLLVKFEDQKTVSGMSTIKTHTSDGLKIMMWDILKE